MLQQPDENSRRLARNTQIVLKQEALLSRVADPLGGAYLVEALDQLHRVKGVEIISGT